MRERGREKGDANGEGERIVEKRRRCREGDG